MVPGAMLRGRNWGRSGCIVQPSARQAKTGCTLVRGSPSLSMVLVKGDAFPGGGVSRPR